MAMISAALEDWVWSFRENNYLFAAAVALLYYDYALTFTEEVNHFWKSASLSLFSTLFVFNRYLGLIGTIPVIIEYFVDLPETIYHQAFSVVVQGVIATGLTQLLLGMLLLRTYALYERSKAVLTLLVITFIGGIAACLMSMLTVNSHSTERATGTEFGRDPSNQCDLSLTTTQ
ncbi:hypothetical protein LXA43DRAFT_1058032 [Ganoderma leucocontextum]|nr:hypothetical protein LXA43DRAFT_1058032 [Ganoderma leucocontextum]